MIIYKFYIQILYIMLSDSINHHKLINNIKDSQKKELDLMLNLEKLPHDNDSLSEQRKLVHEIIKNSKIRVNEFRQLQAMNSVLKRTDARTQAQVNDQLQSLELVEKDLKRVRDESLRNRNINIANMRASQINTYYSDKYRAQHGVVIKIIYLCIPLLVLAILRSRGLINNRILSFGLGLIILVGLFMVVPVMYDISSRNNMVFSEYDFQPDMTDRELGDGDGDDSNMNLNLPTVTCVGPACCTAGMVYDNERNLCVVRTGNESVLSGQSTSQ